MQPEERHLETPKMWKFLTIPPSSCPTQSSVPETEPTSSFIYPKPLDSCVRFARSPRACAPAECVLSSGGEGRMRRISGIPLPLLDGIP